MKCLECGKPEVQCRGMCPSCYTRWRRAGKPPVRFDYKPPAEKFDKDCKNGTVAAMLENRVSHLDIARRYGIAEATARKYMQKNDLITVNSEKVKKKDRKTTFYTPAQMIALAMPWVRGETPKYYRPK